MTISIRFQIPGYAAAQWTPANPVLLDRELAAERDTGKFKLGDGVGAWTDLPYQAFWSKWGRIDGTIADQTDLAAALSDCAKVDLVQYTVTAAYTLAAVDRGRFLYFNAAGITVTVPAAAVTFPAGGRVLFVNLTGGVCTIAPASGVRLFGPAGNKTYSLANNSVATLLKVSGDLWVLFGTGLS